MAAKKSDRRRRPFNAALPKAAAAALPAAPRPAARTAPAAPAAPADDAAAVDEATLFVRHVGPVRPPPGTKHRAPPPRVARPRAAVDDEALATQLFLAQARGAVPCTVEGDSEEGFWGRAAGVSDLLLQQLQRGHFAQDSHLDLHGLQREVAHLAVQRFVRNARRRGERCVLLITGRGRNSPLGEAVLRQALPRWLTRSPCRAHVLAFCTARPSDGGPGAFYVLLRRPGIKPFGEPL